MIWVIITLAYFSIGIFLAIVVSKKGEELIFKGPMDHILYTEKQRKQVIFTTMVTLLFLWFPMLLGMIFKKLFSLLIDKTVKLKDENNRKL